MKHFLRLSLGFYVVATALGLLLRVHFLRPLEGLAFSHVLHAHSHTLYFGWVGLGLLTLAFRQLGAWGRGERAVLWALSAVSAATLVAFLHGGYALPGILVSAASVGVWAWAALRWWWRARGRREVEVAFLRAGMAYVGLALVGALARVALLVAKVEEPRWAALAVFGFLHCFAWFFLFGVMGLLVGHLRGQGVRLEEGGLRRLLWMMVPLAWATFPLGVIGGSEGVLGAVARGAALLLAVPQALWVGVLWRAGRQVQGPLRAALLALTGWFALEGVLAVGGALGLAERAVLLRHPAILFLHVLLVGCVTLALLVPLLSALGRPLGRGLLLHNGGLAVMLLGLAVLGGAGFGLGAWQRVGMVLAALGGAGVVLAGVVWSLPARGRLVLTREATGGTIRALRREAGGVPRAGTAGLGVSGRGAG